MLEKFFQNNDMVKLGCNDCAGCHDCCKGMGSSIILDPYDIMQLKNNLHMDFNDLIEDKLELTIKDGLILPSIKMKGSKETCPFLNEKGRCSIHSFRPGLCRLFPLGRDYSSGKLLYFLLEGACNKSNKTKIKINKWLSVPRIKAYEDFLTNWHFMLSKLRNMEMSDEELKTRSMSMLQVFFVNDFSPDSFFDEVNSLISNFI